jgi:hypothetical protein
MSAKSKPGLAHTLAKQERSRRFAFLEAQGYQGFDSPVDIVIHSVRRKRIDVLNTDAKATIDGIVKAGILYDDGPNQVASGKFTQENGQEEMTIITIREVS